MEKKNEYFTYNTESNGLFGQTFAIGAIVVDKDGKEIEHFIGRCPIEMPVNEKVKNEVLPAMKDIEISHESYFDMLSDFANFWSRHKNAISITNMGMVTETSLWKDMYEYDLIEDTMIEEFTKTSHNPLHEAAINITTYISGMKNEEKEKEIDFSKIPLDELNSENLGIGKGKSEEKEVEERLLR